MSSTAFLHTAPSLLRQQGTRMCLLALSTQDSTMHQWGKRECGERKTQQRMRSALTGVGHVPDGEHLHPWFWLSLLTARHTLGGNMLDGRGVCGFGQRARRTHPTPPAHTHDVLFVSKDDHQPRRGLWSLHDLRRIAGWRG